MIVAVESNFVLELAFRQEQVAHCEQLLALAERQLIELVIPGCSLFEPYETLERRNKHRSHIAEVLQSELTQLARSEGHASLLETSKSFRRALAESGKVQGATLDATIDKMSKLATVIPLTAEVVQHALVMQLRYPLSRQDAVVFASIDKFMAGRGAGSKLFANKNSKDFATAEIEAHLQQYDCKVVASFSAASNIIAQVLAVAD
jgi:hypothetical protein